MFHRTHLNARYTVKHGCEIIIIEVIGGWLKELSEFVSIFYDLTGDNFQKAPSAKHQAPEKVQIPNTKACVEDGGWPSEDEDEHDDEFIWLDLVGFLRIHWLFTGLNAEAQRTRSWF